MCGTYSQHTPRDPGSRSHLTIQTALQSWATLLQSCSELTVSSGSPDISIGVSLTHGISYIIKTAVPCGVPLSTSQEFQVSSAKQISPLHFLSCILSLDIKLQSGCSMFSKGPHVKAVLSSLQHSRTVVEPLRVGASEQKLGQRECGRPGHRLFSSSTPLK